MRGLYKFLLAVMLVELLADLGVALTFFMVVL
jgi:hypothetical protein